MPNWLVINPNTSQAVTGTLMRRARRGLGCRAWHGIELHAATARFGAPYIASEASYAVAGHAVLDAWAHHLSTGGTQPAAVLVGCFGDPGVAGLREISGLPVLGLAEAAFAEAAGHGRFAIVTGGERWQPMLQRLALTLGCGASLAGIHTLAATGAELAADPPRASALLRQACEDAARDFSADAVILGGAGLAGLADGWRDALAFPVIDSVDAGVRQLELACRHGAGQPCAPVVPHPDLLRWPAGAR